MIEPIKDIDAEPAHTRKVILWGQDDLLSQAIGLFLESNMTWEVTRVSKDGNVDDLIEEIQLVKPEVVILCEDRIDEKSTLPSQLINASLCLKVISVGLESNLMQVHSKQNVILQGASDLLSIIESRNSSACAPEKEAKPEKHTL